jgi:hypothetical protein
MIDGVLEQIFAASAADVVWLAHMDAPTYDDIAGLDLTLLAEYERKPTGVKVKIIDRAALAASVVRKEGIGSGADGDGAGFYAAIQDAAEALRLSHWDNGDTNLSD